jgi:hypothetical protein
MGEFVNPGNGSASHIDNVEGQQAAFIFAVPDAFIFQDYNSSMARMVSDARFQRAFEIEIHALVVCVGRRWGMLAGVPFQLGLYYRDAAATW